LCGLFFSLDFLFYTFKVNFSPKIIHQIINFKVLKKNPSMGKRELFFWLLTATVFSVLVLPDLFMDGMFADGIQYTCVSKNLAEGRGSFWFPFISETWNKSGSNAFLEQPPLMYAIQAAFFKLFGSSLYVERFYTLLTALITALLIHRIWMKFVDKAYSKYSWLAILFWISIPLSSWTYRQNMQENTMGIFTTTAIFFGLCSIYFRKQWILNASIAGIFIFLASLTKGLPGLFPLVIAGAALITKQNTKIPKAIVLSSIYLAIPVLIYLLLILFNDSAKESLYFYLNSRLLNRVDTSPVVSSHFYIAQRLGTELLPSMLLSLLIILGARRMGLTKKIEKDLRYKGMLFLVLGLAGSLPLMLTLVQRGFYMSISFPCFGLAFALFTVPFAKGIIDTINIRSIVFRIFQVLLALTFLASIIITVIYSGKAIYSKDVLKDVYTLGDYLEANQTISSDGATYHYWPFQFYMIRYNDIYLEKSPRKLEYFVVIKDSLPPSPEMYYKVELNTSKYDLYHQKLPNE
jgi:hypothetical protein